MPDFVFWPLAVFVSVTPFIFRALRKCIDEANNFESRVDDDLNCIIKEDLSSIDEMKITLRGDNNIVNLKHGETFHPFPPKKSIGCSGCGARYTGKECNYCGGVK